MKLSLLRRLTARVIALSLVITGLLLILAACSLQQAKSADAIATPATNLLCTIAEGAAAASPDAPFVDFGCLVLQGAEQLVNALPSPSPSSAPETSTPAPAVQIVSGFITVRVPKEQAAAFAAKHAPPPLPVPAPPPKTAPATCDGGCPVTSSPPTDAGDAGDAGGG